MLPFPHFNPVALRLGPLAIRWYSLAYIGGILLGWWIFKDEQKKRPIPGMTTKALDDMVVYAVLGIVLGGRLGYVLFYKPEFYFSHPLQILHVWEGGMSFHGGMLGFIFAFFLFARKYHIYFFHVMDILATVAPIGLFLGRCANFVNGELWGRVTDVPWGIVFPNAADENGVNLPRHPSQLYEAGMEGILLFTLLMCLMKFGHARSKPGLLSGMFLVGYAASRVTAEFFRQPDAYLGYLYGGATMGQLLCIPMILFGLYLILRPTPEYAPLAPR